LLKLLVIGIGAGNPEHMTVQAIGTLNRADVVLLPRKGKSKADLADLRREICRRYLTNEATRIVEFDLPQRDRAADAYLGSVDEWHAAIAGAYARLIEDELGGEGTAAFLVWGDPSLYDSTLRILCRLRDTHGFTFELKVIPGITSVQALTASHAMPLNRLAGPVLVTTGRRLKQDIESGADTIVVMLDGQLAFEELPAEDYEIFWGAYLGMEKETIVAGPLEEVSAEIAEKRATERAGNGWIMDVYVLRRKSPPT
jgi:precorrin-6A synthase